MQSIFQSIKKSYKTHLIVWITFIFYELFITTTAFTRFPPVGTVLFYYTMNVMLFYINAAFIYKFSSKGILIPIIILIEITIYCVALYFLEFLLFDLNVKDTELSFSWASITRSLWRGFYFIGFSVGFVYILKALEETRKSAQLEKENLTNTLDNQRLENELVKLENNFLRSQINPHFLFNTLSFIYNGTRKLAPDAASAILSLSDMMRYALKQPTTSETVNLTDEVEQVKNLINLHNLRTRNKAFLDLQIPNDITGVRFLPLVLLTLVENIYKHGNLSNEKNPAVLSIVYQNKTLTIHSVNVKSEQAHKDSNGVGMNNIKKRLESFYKENLTFTFNDSPPNAYEAKLIIKNI